MRTLTVTSCVAGAAEWSGIAATDARTSYGGLGARANPSAVSVTNQPTAAISSRSRSAAAKSRSRRAAARCSASSTTFAGGSSPDKSGKLDDRPRLGEDLAVADAGVEVDGDAVAVELLRDASTDLERRALVVVGHRNGR